MIVRKSLTAVIISVLQTAVLFAQSVAWTSGGAPASVSAGIQRNPCVVSDGSGGALVFYEDARGWNVRGAKIGAYGSIPWPADGIEIDGATDTNGFGSPQAIPDGSGGALIAWEFWSNKTDIAVQRIGTDGGLLWNSGSPVKIYEGGQYDRYPVLVSDGAGGIIVVWMHEESNDPDNMTVNPWSIMACRVNANGSIVWGPGTVAAGQNSRVRPQACSDTKNGAFITWMYYTGSTGYDIYCARVNPVGSVVFADKPVCMADGSQFYPRIIEDDTSGAIIIWHDFRNADADVYAQRISGTGSALWQYDGVAVSDFPSTNEMFPAIARFASGGFVIAWEDCRNGNYDIYAQKVDISGARKWEPNGIAVCTSDGTQNRPVAGTTGDSSYILWQDYSSVFADIYCRVLYADGIFPLDANTIGIAASAGVNESYNMATDPFIGGIACVDSSGSLIIAWSADILEQDIYCQKINTQGAKTWGAFSGIPVAAGRDTEQKTEQVSVIADNAGGAVVVWADAGRGNRDIYARHLSPSGADLWDKGGIAVCTQKDSQLYPVAAFDGKGGYIFTWQDERKGLYVQKVDGAGNLMWAENAGFGGIAYCTAPGGCERPCIIGDSNGGVFVVWMDNRGGNWDIYAQHLGNDGTVLWQENGVPVCTASGIQKYPQILSDMSGGIIVIWEDARAGNFDIYAQRFKADGTALWQYNGTAVCNGQGNQRGPDADGIYGPRAVSDGAGGVITVWQDDRSGWEIYAQRISPDGILLWDMIPADSVADGIGVCTSANTQDFGSLCADGAGGALIVWRDFRNDTGYSDIYAQHVGPDGVPVWAVNGIPVSVESKDQYFPSIAVDNAGGAILAWQDYSNGNDWDIYCARVNADGTFTTPGWSGFNLTAGVSNSMQPLISYAGGGSAVILWQDDRIEAKFDVFGTKVKNADADSITAANLGVNAGAYMPPTDLDVSSDDSSLEMFQVNIANTGTEDVFVISITFSAYGSGDDAQDIDYVRLYTDSNNDGKYDSLDIFLSEGRFVTDDGTVTLAVMRSIAVAGSEDYLVTYDLSGKAAAGADFFTGIASSADINASGAGSSAPAVISVPASFYGNGVTIAPAVLQMSAGENNPGITYGISADGTAIEMMQIKVSNAGTSDSTISSIAFTATGTANEAVDVYQAFLVLDANANGVCDDALYVLFQQAQVFSEDNGRLTFNINRTISPGAYEYWILAYYLNSTISVGDTLSAVVAGTQDVVADSEVKGLPLKGNRMTAGTEPVNAFMAGPGAVNPSGLTVFNSALNVPVMQISIRSDLDHLLEVSSIKVTASGTVDDLTDVSDIKLFADINGDGLRDDGDILLGVVQGFSGDDGTVVFSGAPLRAIPAFGSEQWLAVCDFAGTAASGSSFSAGIISAEDITLTQPHPLELAPVQGGTITLLEGGKLMSSGTAAPAKAIFGVDADNAGVQYQWDFDYTEWAGYRPDWTGTVPEEVVHEYFIPGVHTARLAVINADGAVVYDDVVVTVAPDADAPDVSAWSEVSLSGAVPLNIDFKATAVSLTGYICLYAWDFDGDGIIDWSNTSTGDVTWTYGQAGSYMARFIAADNYGRMNAQEIPVSVSQSSAGDAGADIDAVFTVPPRVDAGQTVYFNAACNTGPAGYIKKYEWDFDGDGDYDWASASTLQASHVYNKNGIFNVTVRVTDSNNFSAVRHAEVYVDELSSLSVWTTQPEGNSSVSGDLVTVAAVAGPEQVVQSVIFQYSVYGTGDWKNIGYFITPPPYEFRESWNTLALAEGQYQLRAVAADANSNTVLSTANGNTIITVAASGPDIWEGTDAVTGEYYMEMKTRGNRAVSVSLYDGTKVYMSYGASAGNDTVLVKKLKQNPTLQDIGFVAGSFRKIGLSSNFVLYKPVSITIPYPDTNNDGVVDGTTVSEKSLDMYHYNTDLQKWEVLGGLEVDTALKQVRAVTGSLSYFVLGGVSGDVNTGGSVNTAPMFSGAASVVVDNETTITVSWNPANDDHTPQTGIEYLIYVAVAPGGADYSAPSYVTLLGVLSYQLTGLAPGTDYYFVVRALDENGNIDANTVELHAKTPASSVPVEESGGKSGKGCFVKRLTAPVVFFRK